MAQQKPKDAKTSPNDKPAGKIKVTLVRSTIGYKDNQEQVVRSLGLRRVNQTVEVIDRPETRGLIHKVRHLVRVEE
jgi:large subunit ribosomal protein L30